MREPSSQQARGNVDPVRIVTFNQTDLPGPSPLLDLLFSADRGLSRFMGFEPNKVVYSVSRGKARHRLTLVFPDPFHEIGSHPYVQGSVGFAGQKIDVKIGRAHV